MNANNQNFKSDQDDKPLDPAVERVRRKVMRLMGISIAIMMIALMAVIGAIFYKISSNSDKNIAKEQSEPNITQTRSSRNMLGQIIPNKDYIGNIDLPQGSELLKAELNDGQILLSLRDKDGSLSLWVYDLATNRVFAKIAIGQ